MMTSKTRFWLSIAGIVVLVVLTWLAPVPSVRSQEPAPGFDAAECAPALAGYGEDSYSAVPGAIVCKYVKEQSGNPSRRSHSSLWLTYYPTAEEATAWIQENYLTDDHLKIYSCATWDDCDKIQRALLEKSDSSFYGYTMQADEDGNPTSISMQRRFVYGTYGASIFVEGRAFQSLDQAQADVAALEQLAKALVDTPREMVAPAAPAGTGTPGATAESPSEPEADPNEGKSCREYCEGLDSPFSRYLSGETYPDCDCACSTGDIFFGGQCISCDTVCTGDDKYTIKPTGGECYCLCKDPSQTWDRATGECVAGEDRTGMVCSEYCDLVDPGFGWAVIGTEENTYPDCDCSCEPLGEGAVYINGLCVPCRSACTGDDVFLIMPSDGPCRCQCQDHTKVWDQATGRCLPGPDTTGMSCVDYCAQLGPGKAVPLASSEETYPDCRCQCQDDAGREYSFFQNQCVPCTEMCRGEGMSVHYQKGGECSCLCTDPLQKWDRATGRCVPLDGTECNYGNGCQPELGENCTNCSDCGCTWTSYVDPNQSVTRECDPENPKADIRGCVIEETAPGDQLETQYGRWGECRDAWATMNLGKFPLLDGTVSVMANMSNLPQISHWQRQCNCTPVAGVVLWNEAVDPMVCLMRCCDRLLNAIDAQELRVKGTVPVVRGPGIKVRPAGAEVEVLEGQTVKFDGSLDLWGNRSIPHVTTFGVGAPQSEYELLHRPGTGMEVYLYEGSYTYTYYDSQEGVVKQAELSSGQMLSVGPDGVPLSTSAFDPANRETWWVDQPYYVQCPEGAHQEGADCYCDEGYETDTVRDVCVPVLAWSRESQEGAVPGVATDPPPLVEVTATPGGPDSAEGEGLDMDILVVILAILLGLIVLALVALIVALLIRR